MLPRYPTDDGIGRYVRRLMPRPWGGSRVESSSRRCCPQACRSNESIKSERTCNRPSLVSLASPSRALAGRMGFAALDRCHAVRSPNLPRVAQVGLPVSGGGSVAGSRKNKRKRGGHRQAPSGPMPRSASTGGRTRSVRKHRGPVGDIFDPALTADIPQGVARPRGGGAGSGRRVPTSSMPCASCSRPMMTTRAWLRAGASNSTSSFPDEAARPRTAHDRSRGAQGRRGRQAHQGAQC
jgi:hypothetical protein